MWMESPGGLISSIAGVPGGWPVRRLQQRFGRCQAEGDQRLARKTQIRLDLVPIGSSLGLVWFAGLNLSEIQGGM